MPAAGSSVLSKYSSHLLPIVFPRYAIPARCVKRGQQRRKRLIVLILILVGAVALTTLFNNGSIVSSYYFPIDAADEMSSATEAADPVMSYCSRKADRRGPKQNVISYSLYGNFSDPSHYNRYAAPLINYILSNVTQVYPGMTV